MKASDDHRPIYIAVALTQRLTSHLTLTEYGTLHLLLLKHWVSDEPLPSAERELARMANCSLRKWRKLAPSVMPALHDVLRLAVHSCPGEEHGEALH